MNIFDFEDTICAVSTPPGQGAIAMIRVSGKKTVEILTPLIRFSSFPLLFSDLEPNNLRLARFIDNEGMVDEVMVTRYTAPRSYTGEDMAEITCHGSAYVQQRILLALIEAGAKAAGPGEFTRRAFLNRKMDLAQAEAVADLIAAESAAAHRLALNQLRGKISDKIKELRTKLLDITSLMELELDFSDEDVEFADRSELLNLAENIRQTLGTLAGSFRQGNAMKKGIPVAIIGEPNVGKSTLLNALLQEDKAIVSEIPGTTRDSIEDTFIIDGYLYRFIDTAGLRDSTDNIEKIGVDRTYRKAAEASVILFVTQVSDNPEQIKPKTESLLKKLNNQFQHMIIVVNKTDIAGSRKEKEMKAAWKKLFKDIVFISALHEINLDRLKKMLVEASTLKPAGDQEIIISNMRHYESLRHAVDSLERMTGGLREGLSSDLVAQDLREAIHYMGEITGEITTDDILGNIFSKFCIGK